jgi:hypothetical protein
MERLSGEVIKVATSTARTASRNCASNVTPLAGAPLVPRFVLRFPEVFAPVFLAMLLFKLPADSLRTP